MKTLNGVLIFWFTACYDNYSFGVIDFVGGQVCILQIITLFCKNVNVSRSKSADIFLLFTLKFGFYFNKAFCFIFFLKKVFFFCCLVPSLILEMK